MKKVTLILLTFTLMNVTVNAQSLDLGIKAGLNMDKFISTGFSSDFHPAVVAGAYLRLGIGGFFLEPDLLYAQKGGKANIFLPQVNQTETKTASLSYLEVPILFGKKFAEVFRFDVGPALDLLLSANETTTGAPGSSGSITNDVKSNYHSATVGFQVGLGLDIMKLGVDLRYDGNLSKVVQATGVNQLDGFSTDTRSSIWQLTLSYKIL
jgi:hypothetical protein